MPNYISYRLYNFSRIATLTACFACFLLLPVCSALAQAAWRSSLYPENWKPGFEDAQGNFLHDFSYAGYHRGEIPIPDHKDAVLIDVTAEPVGEYGGHPTRNPQIIILSQQWDKGYVIGTRGPCAEIDSNDFVEGKGKGDTLSPQSLYLDQLERRKANK
ncbi:MAG TPA: hypothetical protein VK970_06905 [Candidatus Methylacidiphilales bacterium]|nr:hypothetical protein [Candidatus Methylacidiphilales bacterium]